MKRQIGRQTQKTERLFFGPKMYKPTNAVRICRNKIESPSFFVKNNKHGNTKYTVANGLIAWASQIGTFPLPATKFAWQASVSSVDEWGTPGSARATARIPQWKRVSERQTDLYEVFGCFLKWWYPKMDGLLWKPY